MKVIKKPLTELRRPDRNVRMHTDKQLKEFRRSVEMFGQIRPIVVDEDGVILAGNGLYETLLYFNPPAPCGAGQRSCTKKLCKTSHIAQKVHLPWPY